MIKSLFNKYKKQLIFGFEFFIFNFFSSTVPLPGINQYCILSISTTSYKRPSKIFWYKKHAPTTTTINLTMKNILTDGSTPVGLWAQACRRTILLSGRF